VSSATLYARGPFQAGGVVILEDDEAHHLRVRRVADGESVRLVDGRGGIATARVSFDKDVAAARVVATATVPAPAATELLVGAGDRDRFLLVVEKATELGATKLVPLMTERSQQVATRFQSAHMDKANRRAREAVKQCGGSWMPVIASPQPLSEALRAAPPRVARLLADAEGGALPAIGEGDPVQWAIGPEGGFTDEERAALQAAGFKPIALGRATLRFETAAIAALASLRR
jgi:16S rRNA (uracil1498-N3)-methyltransferase